MATAADSSSNAHSPQFRRNARNLSSPWSHVVRGESEIVPVIPSPFPSPSVTISSSEPSDQSPSKMAVENLAAGPSDSVGPSDASQPPLPDGGDQGSNSNAAASVAAAGRGKKPAWNKPSNGFVEVGPVMGAISWPALSESTRASPKSSSSESLQSVSDGSVSAPPGHVIASPPPNPIADNANPSSSANHTRQKSMKRGGGSSGGGGGRSFANGGPSTPPPLSLSNSSPETPQISPDKPNVPESSPRDLPNRNSSNWENGSRGGGFSPQHHGGSDQHRNYGGNRRGNNGGGGGGGPHHNSYGHRRDQDRGSSEWNPPRNFSSRDFQMQQLPQPRAVQRPYIRPPPPGSAPYISPPPQARPYGHPMGFPGPVNDMQSPVFYVPPPPPPESLRGMPFIAPPAMFFPTPETQFRTMLANQIDYYFSSENLCKDKFLRQNMDNEGWVPITLIAGFNRVRKIINYIQLYLDIKNNIQFILDTLRTSTVVEVQGNKIRRRNDWMNWLLPSLPDQSSAVPNLDTLAARMRSVGVEEAPNGTRVPSRTEIVLGRSASGEFSQSQMGAPNGEEGAGQVTARDSSDRSVSARSLVRSDTF